MQFNQSSVLASGGQTFALASLISTGNDAAAPAVLAIRAYDRDAYSGPQSYDYGYFTSPDSGRISAGTQYQPSTLYFDLRAGVYVARDTGEPLSAFNFTSSNQNYRSVYLSLFTNTNFDATYKGNWVDPGWQHISDLDIVTRTDYADLTPNVASPQEIAALAKSFVGTVWNNEGCWLLTSNISAAAGASLPVASAKTGAADISGNSQWQIVFNGAQQTGDWRALLQTGDIVEMGFLGGKAHIATVTSGASHQALWVDNSGPPANDGAPADIVIQGEHSVDDATYNAINSSVVIFRLAAASPTPDHLAAPISPPLVTPHTQSLHSGQSLPLDSLFSVQDPNLLPIASYQIIDHGGSSHIQLNGALNLATAAQQAAGTVIVDAHDITRLTYKASTGPDTLTITAFNGQTWGSANVSVSGWVDPPPVVTGVSLSLHASSQLLAASALFTASAAPGHAITQYRFTDDQHTGQLVLADPTLNLATNEEAALGIYRVSAANLATVGWKTLADSGTISVSAFDGVQWSDFAALTIAGQNSAPVVTPLPRATLTVGQATPVASLFSLSDPDHDAVQMVSIYDYYQHIQLNGATDYCPDPHTYEVKISELGKLTYTAPDVMGGTQGISVYAYDGTSWSAPTGLLFTLDDPHPIIQPLASTQLALGQSLPLNQLMRAVDPNGKAITQYQVQDPAGGGSIHLNGAANLATGAQQAQGVMLFAAADLARVSYSAGSQVGSETLTVSAFNGALWGSNHLALYSTDGAAPVVVAAPATLDVGSTVPLTDLMSGATPSGKAITQYRISDPAGGGAILLNGATNLAAPADQAQDLLIAAADLGKLRYLASASAGSEAITISAYDGASWGQADLLLTSRNFNRPVVTTQPLTVHAGQSVSLQDLFRVSDANGNAINNYQIDDTGLHLDLHGAANIWAAQQYQGIYGIEARDLAKVTYVAGMPGTNTIYIEASDAQNSSMMMAETITVLPNPVVTPTTVTLGIHQTVAMSSLFAAAAPSANPIMQYKIADPAGGGTVFLNGAVNLASAAEQAQGISIVGAGELAKLTYRADGAFSIDHLTVCAYDGVSWGASAVPVTTIDGSAPQLSAPAVNVEVNATLALDSLFAATAHSGQPITLYKIVNPFGGGKIVLNGAQNSATAAQQAQDGMAIVSAADIAKVQYVGADVPGSESLTISAFDGQSWGSASLNIASIKSAPPVIAPATAVFNPGQSVSLSTMFNVSDPKGHDVSFYILQDPDNNIQLNGALNLWSAQQSSGYYWIAASDISRVTYTAGREGVFHFNLIVNDGFNFSAWTRETAVVGQVALPPAILAAETSIGLNQAVPLARLFSAQDPVGNALTEYRVTDPAGGGRVLFNDAQDLASADEHAAGVMVFAAADLDKIQYQGAASGGAEALTIAAYDGTNWGTADIAITSALLPPRIQAATTTVELGHALNLNALFNVQTSSGNAITEYKIQDPHGGGSVLLNGAANLADATQQAQGISIVAARDLARLSYAAADTAGSETLLLAASDGQSWGAANIAISTTDNRAPLLAQTARATDLNSTVWLANFFSATSVSGKPIVEYQIQDPAGGGHVGLNTAHDLASAAQKSQGITVVAAYDLGALLYTGAATAGAETLSVTASDGQNFTTTNVQINSVGAIAPTVSARPMILHSGTTVALADLFNIADPNGYPIQHYIVTDADLGIVLNGASNGFESNLWDYQGHYYLYAADWNKIQYQARTPGTTQIAIQVDDGHNTSAYIEETITVLADSGNNSISGDGGIDTVAYSGARAGYALGKTGTGYSIHDTSGAGSTDALSHIGHIKFADMSINLAVQANAASVPVATLNSLVELYIAYSNRVPDADGLNFWITQAKNGLALEQIGNVFYSAAVQAAADPAHPGGMSNATFVKLIYANVMQRSGASAPSDSDVNLLANHLDSGVTTRAAFVSDVLSSAHALKGDAAWGWVGDLLDQRVSVGKQFAAVDGIAACDPAGALTHELSNMTAHSYADAEAALKLIGIAGIDTIQI